MDSLKIIRKFNLIYLGIMKILNILRGFLILQIRVLMENKVLDVLNNRDDIKKWLLATSDYGDEIQ